MKTLIASIVLLLFSHSTFATTNVVLEASKSIIIAKNTSLTSITSFDPNTSQSKCFLEHESIGFKRTIPEGFRFVVENLVVEQIVLDDVNYRSFLRLQLEMLGGVYSGFDIIGEPILSPRSLAELQERIIAKGQKPLDRVNSSILLLVGEADRKVKLVCNSNKAISLNEVINELIINGSLVPSADF